MWPIYIINLDRAESRWLQSSDLMRRFDLRHNRFPAVDGKCLTVDEVGRYCRAAPDRAGAEMDLTLPEIGCYLSHLKLWEVISSGAAAGAFVFEDDFALEPDARAVLEEISRGEIDWDMLKLYSNRKNRLLDSRPLAGRYRIGTPAVVPMSTIAYAITREAAAGFPEILVPFSRPIDMDLKRWWEHGASIKVVSPSPARYRDAHLATSEIHALRQHKRDAQTGQGLGKILAKFRSQVAFHCYSFLNRRNRRRNRRWN